MGAVVVAFFPRRVSAFTLANLNCRSDVGQADPVAAGDLSERRRQETDASLARGQSESEGRHLCASVGVQHQGAWSNTLLLDGLVDEVPRERRRLLLGDHPADESSARDDDVEVEAFPLSRRAKSRDIPRTHLLRRCRHQLGLCIDGMGLLRTTLSHLVVVGEDTVRWSSRAGRRRFRRRRAAAFSKSPRCARRPRTGLPDDLVDRKSTR
jgi:hypothetical protein